MVSFLKKLGTLLAKAAAVAAGVYPLVQPLLGSGKVNQVTGTVVNDFSLIMQQVVTIETALQGKPGTEKLQALIPLVKNIVMTSEAVANRKIADDALFTKGVQEIAQGAVDVLNSIHPDEAKQA
jgi:hypothetical protein